MAPLGSALLIDFYPTLNATPISIPSTSLFVIANTMVGSPHLTNLYL
jgi:hypothetical protein